MAAIRPRGNRSTELVFAALLRNMGIRGWTLHQKSVIGTPDFYFARLRTAVFIDGCFWHGCKRCFKAPRQNASFWAAKISKNRMRDRKVNRRLRSEGIRVLRIWEHELEKRSGKIRGLLEELK